MLFNSFDFLVFFITVFGVVLILPKSLQWLWILIASCFFYMSWKYEYIIWLIIPSLVDYWVSIKMYRTTSVTRKKLLLALSLTTNLSLLFFFKYYNFLAESVNSLFEGDGLLPNLHVVLPMGISFYTFQTIGYTVDVYRGKLKPETHLGYYAQYVTYFPQLVAGPIERAGHLLGQLKHRVVLNWERIYSGLLQVLWGFFKKVAVADRLGIVVDEIFNNPHDYHSGSFLLGIIFFSFQIYCDFSGYSDIAIGIARMMGVDLMKNFNFPYFSRSLGEFWSRWHISLSTWFRDYVYIPLGGNRTTKWRWLFNLFITFLISGIWHGAAWTFVIWGALNGVFLIFENLLKLYVPAVQRFWSANAFLRFINTLLIFLLVTMFWIFFRAPDFQTSMLCLREILTFQDYHLSQFFIYKEHVVSTTDVLLGVTGITLLLAGDYLKFTSQIRQFSKREISFACMLVIIIFTIGVFNRNEFIYFQF